MRSVAGDRHASINPAIVDEDAAKAGADRSRCSRWVGDEAERPVCEVLCHNGGRLGSVRRDLRRLGFQEPGASYVPR